MGPKSKQPSGQKRSITSSQMESQPTPNNYKSVFSEGDESSDKQNLDELFENEDDLSSDDSSFGDIDDNLSSMSSRVDSGDPNSANSKHSRSDSNHNADKAKAKNREHAKNTRNRKKSYIESLKQKIQDISDDRDKLDQDRRVVLSRLVEKNQVRRRVLDEFFQNRVSSEEVSRENWQRLCENDILLTLPVTPYRSFPPSESMQGQRLVQGVDAIIADAASIRMLLRTITKRPNGALPVEFTVNSSELIILGENAMGNWEFKVHSEASLAFVNANLTSSTERDPWNSTSTSNTNSYSTPADTESDMKVVSTTNMPSCPPPILTVAGMLVAKFSDCNRLKSIVLSYDVMQLMQSLRRVSGKTEFQVIPNSLSVAQEVSSDCRVILNSQLNIVHCNQNWLEIFGSTMFAHCNQHHDGYLIETGVCITDALGLTGDPQSVERFQKAAYIATIGRQPILLSVPCQSINGGVTIICRIFPLYSGNVVTNLLCYMDVSEQHSIRPIRPDMNYFQDQIKFSKGPMLTMQSQSIQGSNGLSDKESRFSAATTVESKSNDDVSAFGGNNELIEI